MMQTDCPYLVRKIIQNTQYGFRKKRVHIKNGCIKFKNKLSVKLPRNRDVIIAAQPNIVEMEDSSFKMYNSFKRFVNFTTFGEIISVLRVNV